MDLILNECCFFFFLYGYFKIVQLGGATVDGGNPALPDMYKTL